MAAAATAAVLGLAAQHAPAPCQTSAPIAFGADASVDMFVRSSHACTIAIKPGAAGVRAWLLDSAPTHGTVVGRGATGIIYRPDPGFKGRDGFEFSIRGQSPLRSGATRFRVEVTVF